MKLSVETSMLRRSFDDVKAVEMIKKAGFDCYDYSLYWLFHDEKDMLGDDYLQRADKLRKISDSLEIECNQAHAPFEIKVSDSFDTSGEAYLRIVRSMEVASILGAKNIVVHAIKDNLPPEVDFYELNKRFYRSLEPYCRRFGICISVENLFNCKYGETLPVLSDPEEHKNFVKELASPYFNVCVDIGHSAITGHKPEDVISAMDKNILKVLHIHDNDNIGDRHMLPYTGDFKWNDIMKALARIGYEGEFTFELSGYFRNLPKELLDDGLDFAQKVGRRLIADFDSEMKCIELARSEKNGISLI